MPDSQKKLLIVDDHQLFSDGLELILASTEQNIEVEQASSARQALEATERLDDFDLILVDLEMPNIDGFGFLRALHEREIHTPVAVVSSSQNRSDIETALQLGAHGFIPKYAPSREMLEGVTAILAGQRFVPEHIVGPIDWPNPHDLAPINAPARTKISKRQIEILRMMHEGSSNRDIATVLDISESAVKTHITRLFKTLGVKNRTACVREALAKKLI